MIECGQYNKLWQSIHMMPEESVQAAIDLRTSVALVVTTPRIGEPFVIGSALPQDRWWEATV